MYDVKHAIRQTGLRGQLREAHGGERHALRRLEDVRVPRDQTHREHPQRDHRREVEGRDARAAGEGVRPRVRARVRIGARARARIGAGVRVRLAHTPSGSR